MKRARDPDVLREAVAARDLTQREVARLVEVSHGAIGFVLDGRPTRPEVARRLARVLRRPLDDLFVDATTSNVQSIDQQKATA